MLAVSDDDFARITIAQRFVDHPSWDPSGTSWLPGPFLVMGTWMRWQGTGLAEAQQVGAIQACVGALALYHAARFLRVRRILAVGAAIAGMVLPYAARLSATIVPEYLTACLIVFGLCSLAYPRFPSALPTPGMPEFQSSWWATTVGATALGFASSSRYEAWPVAAFFALFTVGAAIRQRRPGLVVPALVVLCPAAAWLLHGAVHHGDPLFFVSRVSDYKRALGADDPSSLSQVLAGYPRAILVYEPQIVGAALVAVAASLYRLGRRSIAGLEPAFLGVLTMVLTLVLGDLTGGAPTHHPERAVVSVWLLSAVALACAFDRITRVRSPRLLAPLTIVVAGITAVAGWQLRALAHPFEFANRSAEVAAGRFIDARLPKTTPITVWTRDYGYFAVMAAAGEPDRFHVLERHDPREQPAGVDRELRRRLFPGTYCHAVVPTGVEVHDSVRLDASQEVALIKDLDCLDSRHLLH